MTRAATTAIASIVLTLALATAADAGTYDVTACSGGLGNASWVPEVTSMFATAYTDCGPNGPGIVTRISGGSQAAPYAAGARHVFTPPPGTRVLRFRGAVNAVGANGWYSGFVDATPRWVWGGSPLTTQGAYRWVDFSPRTERLFAQVTCVYAPPCPRDDLWGYVYMKDVVVTVEDNAPPNVAITGGSVTLGGWRRGDQSVSFAANDATGIRNVQVFIDGRGISSVFGSCNPITPRPCGDSSGSSSLDAGAFGGDGRHTVTVRAFDGAGNVRESARSVLIDRTAPTQPIGVAVAGAGRWRRQNSFTLVWRNPLQSASPIHGARYLMCPASSPPGDGPRCVKRIVRAHKITTIQNFGLPGRGDWRVSLWLEDEAGNYDFSRAVTVHGLRFDDLPPTLAFDVATEDDPTRVHVTAKDVTSGLVQAQVEARRRGETAWRSLPTELDRTGFATVLDDEVLPRGTYDLRARAVDRAGNEKSTQLLTNGQPAVRRLPLRIPTRLRVGKPTRVRAKGSHGRRFRTRLVVRPRAHYGRTIPLRGRLTMPGGNPLAGADIEVWQRVKLPGAEWRRISLVRTSRTGRFRFKALRGPSRVLRFRYPGTRTIRARSTEVDLRVRAASSFRVTRSRVVNGDEVVFSGRLKGELPQVGKLIHLQVYTRGRWSTFATPRADSSTGRWRSPYRFTATRGRVVYRFRAFIPREAGFPYAAGSSRSHRVTVRGL